MSIPILGIILSLTAFAVLAGIRFNTISVITGSLIMVGVSICGSFIVGYYIDGDLIETVCIGTLFTFTYGLGMLVFGRILEKSISKYK